MKYLFEHTNTKDLAGLLVNEGHGQTEFHGEQYPGKVTYNV